MKISKKTNVLLFVLLSLAISMSIYSVKVKKISLSNYKEMQKGSLEGIIINDKGEISLGSSIKKTEGPESEFYLSFEIDRQGNRYVGTGHKGILYKIDKNNKISKLFTAKELDIYSILVRKNGDILFGTSPAGKIFKINNKGKSSLFFNPSEKFIWDIKETPDGSVYCAVGNSGGVYKISKLGNGEKVFDSEDPHIMKLFVSKNGSIFAGSGIKGMLYKITNRKTKVVYDSPLQEIKGICEDAYGNIFFSANRGTNKVIRTKKSKKVLLFKGKKLKVLSIAKEKSILYKLDTSGIVSIVWSSMTENIYSVLYDKKRKSVIIGTGNSGRVYSINESGFNLLYESDSAQAFSITKTNDGIYLITNNTPSIIKIENKINNSGTYFSKIIDLKFPSKLGKAYWKLQSSNDSRVLVYLRAGNSVSPDKFWLKWTAPYSDNKGTKVDISGYRYIQIKIVLNTSNPNYSPVFKDFSLYFLPANMVPKIQVIKIKQKNKKIEINIKANDPNKDKIQYNVYMKKSDKKNWVLFKKNITSKKIILKKELFENGEYKLKIIANDTLQNPIYLAKSDIKFSEPFIIDSTPPDLINFLSKDNNISFEIVDMSIVSNVLYSYDGLKNWNPIFPDDMVSDSNKEKFIFKLKNTKNKNVFIKVSDEFNNYKIYQKEY